MISPAILTSPNPPTWCAGCGDFGIWQAFREAAGRAGWNNRNSVAVAGIGCHGHIVNFIELTSFEGLHGRPIPVASGIKLANHRLNVFVFTGDGDCLAEGGNHFIHAARRNQNITVILHDNAIYGLTTGQTSPRSPKGFKSKSTPQGNLEEPLHPLRLALAAGATFLARGYSGDVPGLTNLMIKAQEHSGFAVLQVLQPCVTFNRTYTHIFYQQNMYQLGPDHDASSKIAAYQKLLEWGIKQIPMGIFYQVREPAYEEQIVQLKKQPLVAQVQKRRTLGRVLKMYQ